MTTWWRSLGEGVKEQDIYSAETRSNGCQLVTALGVEPRILPEQKSQRKVIASPSFSYEWRHWLIDSLSPVIFMQNQNYFPLGFYTKQKWY
jgi:hypothetical protein